MICLTQCTSYIDLRVRHELLLRGDHFKPMEYACGKHDLDARQSSQLGPPRTGDKKGQCDVQLYVDRPMGANSRRQPRELLARKHDSEGSGVAGRIGGNVAANPPPLKGKRQKAANRVNRARSMSHLFPRMPYFMCPKATGTGMDAIFWIS
jgi:hypothetical protein